MRFGLQKLTLLDFPGMTACTVFTSGCNFRCPFCHNPGLVFGGKDSLDFDLSGILDFLEKRRGILDGICITGGEPLLHEETVQLAKSARAAGYKVKIDTNGSDPEKLRQIVEDDCVDYVAMDIKNSPEKYEATTSFSGIEKIRKSVQFLLQGRVDYEFRTTVTGNLHTADDFEKIGSWIAGAKRYFLQKFQDSGELLSKDGSVFEVSGEQLAEYQGIVKKFVPSVLLRGI